VVSSEHEGGIVLMDIAKGQLFASNRTGARIWRALEAPQSLETISAAFSRDYRLPSSSARFHIERFIEDLVSHGLVQMEDRR